MDDSRAAPFDRPRAVNGSLSQGLRARRQWGKRRFMSLAATLAGIAAAVAIALFCGWMGARPPDPRRGPRLIPYRAIMLLSGTVAVLLVVHLANLFGLRTGR